MIMVLIKSSVVGNWSQDQRVKSVTVNFSSNYQIKLETT